MSINEARAKQIIGNLTGVAKKVYDVTPITQAWSSGFMVGELFRQGHRVDKRTVDGVLNSLVDQGLVIERKRGEFTRAPIRTVVSMPSIPESRDMEIPKPVQQVMTPQAIGVLSPKQTDLLDRMAAISGKLRDLGRDANSLAHDIDEAALSAQQRIEGASADASKLRQLQQLLRSINSDGG